MVSVSASVSFSCTMKVQKILLAPGESSEEDFFWHQLTRVVLEKGP